MLLLDAETSYLGPNNNNKNLMIIKQQLPLANKCQMVDCDEIIKTKLCALNQMHFLIPMSMEFLKQFYDLQQPKVQIRFQWLYYCSQIKMNNNNNNQSI